VKTIEVMLFGRAMSVSTPSVLRGAAIAADAVVVVAAKNIMITVI
jgi:hypothetical protein